MPWFEKKLDKKMLSKKETAEMIGQMRPEDRPPVDLIYDAEMYFKETAAGLTIRFCYEPKGSLNADGEPRDFAIVKMIIAERLCLFFYRYDSGWVYDGFEAGNYVGECMESELN
jgi:hypothetical protein